ncbi:hypothetical protein GCM10009837_42720 [Streptomyces durmitorensis]
MPALLREGRTASALILGSRGRSGLAELLLGAVLCHGPRDARVEVLGDLSAPASTGPGWPERHYPAREFNVMTVRVGINGVGRIARTYLRAAFDRAKAGPRDPAALQWADYGVTVTPPGPTLAPSMLAGCRAGPVARAGPDSRADRPPKHPGQPMGSLADPLDARSGKRPGGEPR